MPKYYTPIPKKKYYTPTPKKRYYTPTPKRRGDRISRVLRHQFGSGKGLPYTPLVIPGGGIGGAVGKGVSWGLNMLKGIYRWGTGGGTKGRFIKALGIGTGVNLIAEATESRITGTPMDPTEALLGPKGIATAGGYAVGGPIAGVFGLGIGAIAGALKKGPEIYKEVKGKLPFTPTPTDYKPPIDPDYAIPSFRGGTVSGSPDVNIFNPPMPMPVTSGGPVFAPSITASGGGGGIPPEILMLLMLGLLGGGYALGKRKKKKKKKAKD